jgi:serine/threonine protein kinase
MAPEQATGLALKESSDWYAFAVMLFEALTGRLPFVGSSIDMLRATEAGSAEPFRVHAVDAARSGSPLSGTSAPRP